MYTLVAENKWLCTTCVCAAVSQAPVRSHWHDRQLPGTYTGGRLCIPSCQPVWNHCCRHCFEESSTSAVTASQDLLFILFATCDCDVSILEHLLLLMYL